MKAIENLKVRVAKMGCELTQDDYTIYIDAPKGYVFDATGCSVVVIPYFNNYETFAVKAIKEAMPDLKDGLRKADEEEIERLTHERDEDWTTANAPEHIEFV